MRDKDFKNLEHKSENYFPFSSGKIIPNTKYAPDYSLTNHNGEYLILENENLPNRKPILANILKAGIFLSNERKGILVIVIKPKSSLVSYIKNSIEYFNWIRIRTNLIDVFFIDNDKYIKNNRPIQLLSKEFLENSISLKNFKH